MTPAETSPGICHVVAGVHIGRMSSNLPATFGSVLTVATRPGAVRDGVMHRHQHLSYFEMNLIDLNSAVEWVLQRLATEKPILIRSEGGRQRPALVAAMCILRMGGYYHDAMNCVHAANPEALTDFRYRTILREADEVINARLHR